MTWPSVVASGVSDHVGVCGGVRVALQGLRGRHGSCRDDERRDGNSDDEDQQSLDADGGIRASDPASRGAVRYTDEFLTSRFADDIVPTVPAGKDFIITYVSARGVTGIGDAKIATSAECELLGRHSGGGASMVVAIPMTLSGSYTAAGSQSVFSPIKAGEAAYPSCSINPAGSTPFHDVVVGGYCVSAP